MEQLKTCSKCKAELPISSFGEYIDKRNGRKAYRASCKPCACSIQSARRAANPDLARANERARRPKYKARMSAWREANREQLLLKALERYHANKDRYRSARDLWRSLNADKLKDAEVRRYAINKKERKAAFRAWYKSSDYVSTDKYIARLLFPNAPDLVPPAYIEAMRKILKTKRLIKEKS